MHCQLLEGVRSDVCCQLWEQVRSDRRCCQLWEQVRSDTYGLSCTGVGEVRYALLSAVGVGEVRHVVLSGTEVDEVRHVVCCSHRHQQDHQCAQLTPASVPNSRTAEHVAYILGWSYCIAYSFIYRCKEKYPKVLFV